MIEHKPLFLEQVLVDFQDIPIFFLCKNDSQYYIVLCTDIENLNYAVAKLSMLDTYNLLHGIIPMRDVFLKQTEYWEVVSGDKIGLDTVSKKCISELDNRVLPDADACFQIPSEQIKAFVEQFVATDYASTPL